MLFDNAQEARAFCLKHVGSDQESREAISAAITPAIQYIDMCTDGFAMTEGDIKELLRDDDKFFNAITDYIFKRYVTEFAYRDEEGYFKSFRSSSNIQNSQ